MKKKPSVKVVLDTRYEKQNSDKYPAKLRVTWERKQKYYSTDYEFTQKEWDKMHGKSPDSLGDTLDELLEIEKRAKGIIKKLRPFSFDAFKKKYNNQNDTTKLDGAFKEQISELRELGQIGTAITYECASTSFEKFSPNAMIGDVTVEFLKKYDAWMKKNECKPNTISNYVRCLRRLINKAITNKEFDQDYYPFFTKDHKDRYQIPYSRTNKRPLTEKELSKIYFYEPTDEASTRAKDFWIFLYDARGMNPTDLAHLKYSDILYDIDGTDYLETLRVKTENTDPDKSKKLTPITKDMKRIIENYGQRKYGSTSKEYIFPILTKSDTPERTKQLVQQLTHWVNDHMKEIAAELEINKKVTTMFARHAWANVQLQNNTSISEISMTMHRGNFNTTKIYLGGLSIEQNKKMTKAASAFKKNKVA